MAHLFTLPRSSPLSELGVFTPGAIVSFYTTGTSTPRTVYADSALSVPHGSSVEAGDDGSFPPIYMDEDLTAYKIVVTDADGVPLPNGTIDPYSPIGGLTQSIIGQLLNPQTEAEAAAGVTVIDYSVPSHDKVGYVYAARYGCDNTGATDSTAAIQAAVDVAVAANSNTVMLPHGLIRVAGAITIPTGIVIMGPGSQGSNFGGHGCSILHHSNGHLFVWNPTNGIDFEGTGGGLKNVTLVKQTGYSGGYPVYVVNVNDDRRCGEMMFDNVLIYGTGTGLWTQVRFDGTATDTPGARGIRSVLFNKFRVASCTVNNSYVRLSQCTHVHGNIQIDQANGTGTPGMTIDGFWDTIHLDLRVGAIVVEHDGTPSVDFPSLHLSGFCETLDVNFAGVVGNANLMVGSSINNSAKGLKISSQHADAFLAYKNANQANQTGNGAAYNVVYDAELYDKNGSFDPATGIATLKCAGLHEFKAGVTVGGLTALHTSAVLNLIHQDSGGTPISSVEKVINIGAIRNATNTASMDIAALLDCSEGDTVRVRLTISNGGSNDADIVGSGSTLYTYFAGKLLA